MKILRYLPIVAVALFLAVPAMAQDDTQVLTYEVEAINEIAVNGAVSLVINAAVAGSEPTADEDATSTYDITTNETGKKITIALDAVPAADVTLTALLGEPTGATATTVTFTDAYMVNTAVDAVTGISEVAESGLSITWGLEAPVTAGTVAQETVNVTYTIVNDA